MSDSPLHGAILDALSDRLSASGGMVTGSFVLVAEVLDANGGHATYIAAPTTQPTHRTMGLLAYADEYYHTEARMQITGFLDDEDEDEEE